MTVVFDMDGTLFAGDSQLRFARWVLRRCGWWRRAYLLFFLPVALLAGLRIVRPQVAKRAFFSFAWGLSREKLQEECRAFAAEELLPSVFPEVLRRLNDHLSVGDEVVLCSASPVWWTRPFAELLGIRRVIATPLRLVRDRVPLLPRIEAPGNNRGVVKLQRLAAAGISHADLGYTDSTANLPLLSICSRAVLVNPPPRLVRQAPPRAEILRPGGVPSPIFFTLACLTGSCSLRTSL